MQKGRSFFDRHLAFVREQGLKAPAARAKATTNFWHDPEAGPWASVILHAREFEKRYVAQDVKRYLDAVAASRDALFNDTMPSGVRRRH